MMPQERLPQHNGFMMPTIVVMLGVATVILLAILQYVTTTTNLTSQVVYRQIALTAARGAMDYGKEQFDANAAYAGTPETTMFTNSLYRVTYQLVSVSVDGRIMRVQGIGRVYFPATATSARYVREVNGEIIRSQITAEDPSDFSPLAWYDASCNDNTNNDAACNNNTVLGTTSTTASGSPTSLREERNNGNYCNGSPQTTSPSNNQLDITRGGECGASNQQDTGFMFNLGSSLPKGVTITNATLKLTSNAVDSQSKSVSLKGIDANNYANFTTSSSSQLNVAPLTSASVTWAIAAWNSVGQSAAPQTSPNIASVIQEIIDRPGWVQGNNIGIKLESATGSGTRRARTTGITLSVTYSGSGAANNGDSVQTWRDRSGNGFDLTSGGSSGNWPVKSTIAVTPTTAIPHGKPMIRFQSGASYMTATVPSGFGSTADSYTAFALMRVKSGTTTDGNATLVGFYGSGTGNVRLSPFRRATNGTDICIARATTNRLCNSYGSSIAGTPSWTLWGAREAITERDMQMRRNGHNPTIGASVFYDPITLNAPFNIVIGANASNNTPNSDMEMAEIIIYDRILTCPQIEGVEKYMADKWGFSDTSLAAGDRYSSDGCTENDIPTY